MSLKPRILMVDDDPTNLRFLTEVLEDRYGLLAINSGESVLECLPKFRPDLILLDVMLPGIDGYEVCRRIRQQPEQAGVRIILISAKAMVSEQQKGYAAGADLYLTKPFDHIDLLKQINLLLQPAENSGP